VHVCKMSASMCVLGVSACVHVPFPPSPSFPPTLCMHAHMPPWQTCRFKVCDGYQASNERARSRSIEPSRIRAQMLGRVQPRRAHTFKKYLLAFTRKSDKACVFKPFPSPVSLCRRSETRRARTLRPTLPSSGPWPFSGPKALTCCPRTATR